MRGGKKHDLFRSIDVMEWKTNLSPSILKKWFPLSREVGDRGGNGGAFKVLLRQKLIFSKVFW